MIQIFWNWDGYLAAVLPWMTQPRTWGWVSRCLPWMLIFSTTSMESACWQISWTGNSPVWDFISHFTGEFTFKGLRTLQRFSEQFFYKNCCENCCPNINCCWNCCSCEKKVVVCMGDSRYPLLCSFSHSVRGCSWHIVLSHRILNCKNG